MKTFENYSKNRKYFKNMERASDSINENNSQLLIYKCLSELIIEIIPSLYKDEMLYIFYI